MATVNLKMPARLHLHVPQRIPCSVSSLYTFFAYVHVHDIFTPTGITINVPPPGLWGKEQLTENEAKESRKISKGRIHVERAIKYLKNYHIFDKMHVRYFPYATKIIFVYASLTNLAPMKIKKLHKRMEMLSLRDEWSTGGQFCTHGSTVYRCVWCDRVLWALHEDPTVA